MKLLECKIIFLDNTNVECNSLENVLKVVFTQKKNKHPVSLEIAAIDETGKIYKTRLNFVEFSTQQRVIDKNVLSHFVQQKLLGEILVEEKIITEQQLKEVIEIQSKYKEKLGEILVKFGYCTPEQILYA
ncbi:MAG: hypothetical protein N2Z73_02180, partial [Endomicrobia bacterium]|nr:hypothetical protein [Endomicrobiia bacterium]